MLLDELSEDDRKRDCDCLKDKIGEEVLEQLDYTPVDHPVKVRALENISYEFIVS